MRLEEHLSIPAPYSLLHGSVSAQPSGSDGGSENDSECENSGLVDEIVAELNDAVSMMRLSQKVTEIILTCQETSVGRWLFPRGQRQVQASWQQAVE